MNEKAQEVNNTLHELPESENLWIIKYQHFKPQYHLNRSKLHPNRKGTNMIEANFKKFFNGWFVNTRKFSNRNFANNMNIPGFQKDSGKDKCDCSIDILPATETNGNAHEDLKISFEDSYDDMMTIPSTLLSLSILAESKLMRV